jgi:hypothetical protein
MNPTWVEVAVEAKRHQPYQRLHAFALRPGTFLAKRNPVMSGTNCEDLASTSFL